MNASFDQTIGQLFSKEVPTSKKRVPTSNSKKSTIGNQPNNKRKQVRNACVTCRKDHSGCDEQRPCKRCVKLGLEDTCVDAPRKKSKKTKYSSEEEEENENTPTSPSSPALTVSLTIETSKPNNISTSTQILPLVLPTTEEIAVQIAGELNTQVVPSSNSASPIPPVLTIITQSSQVNLPSPTGVAMSPTNPFVKPKFGFVMKTTSLVSPTTPTNISMFKSEEL